MGPLFTTTMPRGLILRGGAWVETEITPEMTLDVNGRRWSHTDVGYRKDHKILHKVMHPVGNAFVTMLLSFTDVRRGIDIIRPEGTLIYAVDADDQIIDYNPRCWIIACMITQMIQPPTIVLSGHTDTGLHLRSIEVCREMREQRNDYNTTTQYTVWLKQTKAGVLTIVGCIYFVVLCNSRYAVDNNIVQHADVTYMKGARETCDNDLARWGFGTDIAQQFPDAYVYIIYVNNYCIEDITNAPMAATMLSHLLSDEDAMVFAGQ